MSEELKVKIIKRFKALGWGLAMMAVAGVVDMTIQIIPELNLPNEATVLLGLVLAQVSKYLNTKK